MSGFFSASEAALSAYRSNYLEKLDEEKNPKKYAVMKKWLKDPNAMLTGIVIGNNIVNILSLIHILDIYSCNDDTLFFLFSPPFYMAT